MDDQTSLRSVQHGQGNSRGNGNGLPRSTSTNDLFSFPSYGQKRFTVGKDSGAHLHKSMSITNLDLIPEHKTNHRMTPYQIQRTHMKQSFQFPNGENFTPRKRLPKSASCVSLDKNRYEPGAGPGSIGMGMGPGDRRKMSRSSSMVSVSLPQSSGKIRQNNKYRPSNRSSSELVDSWTPLAKPQAKPVAKAPVTKAPVAKAPTTSTPVVVPQPQFHAPLTASTLYASKLQERNSQLSINSLSQRQTTSSNESQSTDTSLKETCDPGSATSTDLSDEDLTKKFLAIRQKKSLSPEAQNNSNPSGDRTTSALNSGSAMPEIVPLGSSTSTIAQLKPSSQDSDSILRNYTSSSSKVTPVKRSGSRLGSLFKRLLPSKKKAKKDESPQKTIPSHNLMASTIITPPQTSSSSKLFPSQSDTSGILLPDTEDDVDDERLQGLMDIDLVFDSILLKSEQRPQHVVDNALIKQFNRCIQVSSPPNSTTSITNTTVITSSGNTTAANNNNDNNNTANTTTSATTATTTTTDSSTETVQPPKRSSRRPMMRRDSQGRIIHSSANYKRLSPDSRIMEHLRQNWKAVHDDSVIPSTTANRNKESSTASSSSSSSLMKKCRFNDEIYVKDTFSALEYARSDKGFLENRRQLLKSIFIDGIKMELNEFKKREMLVHPNSTQYTHFFL